MPQFEYTALGPGGRVTGLLAANSEAAVVAELESKSLQPVHVRERPESSGFLPRRKKVKTRQLSNAYLQLSELLSAGVPVLRSLTILSRSKSNPAIGAAFREIAEFVADGGEMSEAMSRRPEVFPRVHVAMVRAGEKGGFLDQVLKRLAEFTQGQAELRANVLSGVLYPAVLISVGLVILLLILAVGVPFFKNAFQDLDPTRLPLITKALFGLSALITTHWLGTLIALVVAAVGLRYLLKQPEMRERFEVARTKLPLIGPLTRSLATARFCRMLGTMESNGVPLIQAMQIAREAAGNMLLEKAITDAAEAVRSGDQIAPSLAESGLFDEDILEMISVGEQSGHVDTVLLNIADTVESRITRLLSTLLKLVEPILLLTIAVVLVVIAVGLLLPMLQLSAV